MLNQLLKDLEQYGHIAGFDEVLADALDGKLESMFCLWSELTDDVHFDAMGARKTVDEYINAGLQASWEECNLATYRIGNSDTLRKYYIRVSWT